MRTPRLLALSIALLLAAPARSRAGDPLPEERLLEGAKLSLVEALERGLAQCKEGAAFHAELELDKGRAVFSIDVALGTRTCNAVFDAQDGTLVEEELAEEDHAAVVAAAKVTLKAAILAALAHRPGSALEAQLVPDAGKPVVTVRILAKGEVHLVEVDAVTGAVLAPAAEALDPSWTSTFAVPASEWTCTGENPWFSLMPGVKLVLEGLEDGESLKLTITVLDETLEVDDVKTRVVEEREEQGGELVEVSRNFFALSTRTNSVYYFGEDVDIYEGGKVVRHDGAWRSGVNGARYGLLLPGTPLLGARYHQEVAPGVALDRAEIVGLAETLTTSKGTFTPCLKVAESTPLEPGKLEHKLYAPGVGLVRDGAVVLTTSVRRR